MASRHDHSKSLRVIGQELDKKGIDISALSIISNVAIQRRLIPA
jgi:hypothetical protein